jgi:hypothetical protein
VFSHGFARPIGFLLLRAASRSFPAGLTGRTQKAKEFVVIGALISINDRQW